jgi:hypothetical protein
MSASGRSIPLERGRGFDLGRSLVIATALAAMLSAGFAAGRLTDADDGVPVVTTIEGSASVAPELADQPPRHTWGVKSGHPSATDGHPRAGGQPSS